MINSTYPTITPLLDVVTGQKIGIARTENNTTTYWKQISSDKAQPIYFLPSEKSEAGIIGKDITTHIKIGLLITAAFFAAGCAASVAMGLMGSNPIITIAGASIGGTGSLAVLGFAAYKQFGGGSEEISEQTAAKYFSSPQEPSSPIESIFPDVVVVPRSPVDSASDGESVSTTPETPIELIPEERTLEERLAQIRARTAEIRREREAFVQAVSPIPPSPEAIEATRRLEREGSAIAEKLQSTMRTAQAVDAKAEISDRLIRLYERYNDC